MRLKYKILGVLVVLIAMVLGLFLGYPRGASLLLSYKKQCKVLRVEPFSKAMVINGTAQMNKFSRCVRPVFSLPGAPSSSRRAAMAIRSAVGWPRMYTLYT